MWIDQIKLQINENATGFYLKMPRVSLISYDKRMQKLKRNVSTDIQEDDVSQIKNERKKYWLNSMVNQ